MTTRPGGLRGTFPAGRLLSQHAKEVLARAGKGNYVDVTLPEKRKLEELAAKLESRRQQSLSEQLVRGVPARALALPRALGVELPSFLRGAGQQVRAAGVPQQLLGRGRELQPELPAPTTQGQALGQAAASVVFPTERQVQEALQGPLGPLAALPPTLPVGLVPGGMAAARAAMAAGAAATRRAVAPAAARVPGAAPLALRLAGRPGVAGAARVPPKGTEAGRLTRAVRQAERALANFETDADRGKGIRYGREHLRLMREVVFQKALREGHSDDVALAMADQLAGEAVFAGQAELPSSATKLAPSRALEAPLPGLPPGYDNAARAMEKRGGQFTFPNGQQVVVEDWHPIGLARLYSLRDVKTGELLEVTLRDVAERFGYMPFKTPLTPAAREAVQAERTLPTAALEASMVSAAKEPWQMTFREFVELESLRGKGGIVTPGRDVLRDYQALVRQALTEGKPVPPEVLAEVMSTAAREAVPEVSRARRLEALRQGEVPVEAPVAVAGAPPPPEPPQPPVATGAIPPEPPIVPPTPPVGGLPPGPQDPDALVQALSKAIRGAKRPLAAKEAEVSRELGRRAAQAQARLQAGDRVGARGAFVGQLPDAPDILPVSREFTGADGETLRRMIATKYTTGNLGDSFRFMQADTAFTKLWDQGQIPTRSELVVLEEVFGKPFVESVLSLRTMPTRAWELFLELWNVPRTMLASGDISASLRQGAPFIFTDKGKPWLAAFEQQLRAFANEGVATASAQRIATHPLYASSQRAGLDLTVPATVKRAAPVAAREEPFIGARLVGKIPLYGKLVQASERAYVTMLNEVRFSTFVREAEKLGAEATTQQLRDIARTVNILSGRAPLGKFAEASTILNGIFFAPRFALSRVMAPMTVLIGSAPSRELAAQMLVSYVGTVTGMLALADMSGVAKVEWDPRSSDFGKFKVGNTRIDPWAGLQQPVVLVSRLATGQTKQLSSGQLKALEASQAVQRFLESKLQPSPRVILQRGEGFVGEKPFGPSPIPGVPRIVFDNFVFIFAQDVLDAIVESGPKGAAVAPLSVLGVGVQTFKTGLWAEDFADYFALSSNIRESRAKRRMSREEYRKRNPEVDAKLFLTGNVASLASRSALPLAVALMQQQRIPIEDVPGLEVKEFESQEHADLRRYFQHALGQQPAAPPPVQRSPAPAGRSPLRERLKRRGPVATPTPTPVLAPLRERLKQRQPVGVR